MGKVARQQEESPMQTSPRTPSSSNSSTSSSNSTSNGGGGGGGGGAAAASTAPPSTAPGGVPRPDANQYPTTFVQADPSSFKQVVQMLTGSTETASRHHQAPAAAEAATPSNRGPIPPAKTTGPKRPAFKLYERRHHSFKNLKAIGPLLTSSAPGGRLGSPGGGFSPRKPDVLSPSLLDFPALTLSSPVTPLIPDPFNRPAPHPNSAAAVLAEERAIAEKGFYLHPSPRTTTPRGADPPRLLPLFPVASPRLTSGGPSTAATS